MDVPRRPPPRCAKHNLVMMWYGETNFGGRARPKYRCAICVADAKIKIDRECENYRRHGHKKTDAATQ